MKRLLLAAFLLTVASGSAHAVGIGVKAGTVGSGAEFTLGLTETINARVSVTSYDIGSEEETFTVGDSGAEGDFEVELDVGIGTSGVLFDWHVFGGGFHLTAGLLQNDASFDFEGNLEGGVNFEIDGENLNADDINGNVTGDITLGDSFQPYIGLGYGRRAGDGGGLTFTAEIGVALLDPSASFEATVDAGGTNTLNQSELDDILEGLESDVESELDEFELWPVITLGLNYAF